MSDKDTEQAVAPKKTATTIQDHLNGETFKRQIAMVLPKHLTPERFVRVALTAITRTPKLAQCDQHSFFQALITLSQLGLEPDGRRAHLIPFENRKRGCIEVQLIVDYKGLVELVMRSGLVANLHADVVCENDTFEYDCGQVKSHKIDFRKDRGAVYAAYATAFFKDGPPKSEAMSKVEIEVIRSRSRAAKDGPWVTDWREMAKKTVFRRLSKWLSLSPELRDAVEADDEPLEQKRFEAAKPVFDPESIALFKAAVPLARPLSEPPPPQPPDDEAEGAEFSLPTARVAAEIGKGTYTGAASELTPHQALAVLLADNGYTYDDLLEALAEDGLIDLSPWPSLEEIPLGTVQRLIKSKAGLVRTLANHHKGKPA